MISKQDKVATRTAAGLEQKYNFGKTFAEVVGIATDAQSAASEAKEAANATAARLTHEEIFNLLTNNETLQGIYRGEDGELYINAEYIKSGLLYADLVRLVGADAGDIGRYVFNSLEELNSYVEDTVASMTEDTQKTIGATLDFDPYYIYGIITMSLGRDGDAMKTAHVTLSTGYYILHRYAWSEDGETLHWEAWRTMVDATSSPPSVVREYASGDWWVREWSNGQCELWYTITATVNITGAWGGVYASGNSLGAVAYPVTFANAPNVQCTAQVPGSVMYGTYAGTAGTTTTSPRFSVWRGTSVSNVPVRLDLYVKGTLA